MPQPGEISVLIGLAHQGDAHAVDRLYLLVQDQLRVLAEKVLARRAMPGVDICATMLVNDAFLKLVGENESWNSGDRAKFFGFAARKMQGMLIDAARHRAAKKREGGLKRVDGAAELAGDARAMSIDDLDGLLDLQSALERFEAYAPQEAAVFRMRFFMNCTFAEIAEALEIAETSVKRHFSAARSRLQMELKSLVQD